MHQETLRERLQHTVDLYGREPGTRLDVGDWLHPLRAGRADQPAENSKRVFACNTGLPENIVLGVLDVVPVQPHLAAKPTEFSRRTTRFPRIDS